MRFSFWLNCSTNNAPLSNIENIQTRVDNGEFDAGSFVELKNTFDIDELEDLF